MTTFRHHRGGLIDSMSTCVDVADVVALAAELGVLPEDLRTRFYCRDERIGWDTWIVIAAPSGYGVFGFSNGPVSGVALC